MSGAPSSANVDAEAAAARPAIVCRGISKRFPGQVALEEVDFHMPVGEIHALVGENGAGKSTLLGILSGRLTPTTGTVEIFGEPLRFGDPRASRRAGIATIYQELTIVPALSAKANVFLGQEALRSLFLSEQAMTNRFDELCADFGVRIDSDAQARSLAVADQQMLEIMRGVEAHAKILLFDEPTAALSEEERTVLLREMRRLKEAGVTIVFVSHNLDEVLAVADMVTVLRDAHKIRTAPREAWTKSELVRTMLGGATVASYGHTRSARPEEALRAEGVTLPGAIEDISINVRRGEILGLAGLVGAGRTSVLRCLAGVEPQSTGRLWIDGSEVRWPRKPRDALRYGIALLPEERKTDGLVLGMSVADNLTLPNLRRASRFGLVSQRRQRALASELLERFNLSSRRVATAARNLSGGNQQKVVLGKWMYARPKVLLCDEPTRGIDVGAKAEVLASIEEAAESGLAVIMTSSELEEVLAVSDRVTVLAAGRLVTEYNARARELSVSEVLHAAFGLHDGDETGNKAH